MTTINNVENIAIYPCTPRYALSHMKFMQAGDGFYDKFLEFDKYDFQANILQHTKWLFDESKNKDFSVYLLMNENYR